jgi:hypothetical protein
MNGERRINNLVGDQIMLRSAFSHLGALAPNSNLSSELNGDRRSQNFQWVCLLSTVP